MNERTDTTLDRHLDELADFEPAGFPVVSLYMNTQPDRRGRDDFDRFVRKEFSALAKSFAPDSPERASFERDAERIRAYVREELRPPVNGAAVQADELLLSAAAREIRCEAEDFDGVAARGHGVPAQLFSESREPHLLAADLLVAHARQTGARVTFVEDAALLDGVGGVGALLRYRL